MRLENQAGEEHPNKRRRLPLSDISDDVVGGGVGQGGRAAEGVGNQRLFSKCLNHTDC